MGPIGELRARTPHRGRILLRKIIALSDGKDHRVHSVAGRAVPRDPSASSAGGSL